MKTLVPINTNSDIVNASSSNCSAALRTSALHCSRPRLVFLGKATAYFAQDVLQSTPGFNR